MNRASRANPKTPAKQPKNKKITKLAKRKVTHKVARKPTLSSTTSTHNQSSSSSPLTSRSQSISTHVATTHLATPQFVTPSFSQNTHTKSFSTPKRAFFKTTSRLLSDAVKPVDPTSTATPSASSTDEQEPQKPAKKLGKFAQMREKYGKLTIYCYFGVYFATLATLTVGVNLIPGFDGQEAIEFARSYVHLDRQIGWFQSILDEYPAIGKPIKQYPKQFANFGAAWCLTKLTEPLRIVATGVVTKYIAEKREKAKELQNTKEQAQQH